MSDFPEGPSDPAPASGSDEAAPIRHVGGPWFEVDTDAGTVKVRGREAAEEALNGPTGDGEPDAGSSVPPEPDSATEAAEGYYFIAANHGFDDGETFTFRGPKLSFDLPTDGVIGAVVRDGIPVDVTVSGRTVTRTSGHFGRGRWTVHYQPA